MRVVGVLVMLAAFLAGVPRTVAAQELTVATVTRPPFSMVEDGAETGFSLELFAAIAADLGWQYRVDRRDSFADMLAAVQDGRADAAVANISITASREPVMDFSHPIFESGIQMMLPSDSQRSLSLWRAMISRELVGAILAAFALLFLAGMAMWALERKRQDYFNRSAKEALFPAFWWALNLVVNGGFEERVPRSFLGRVVSVIMVIGSLFIVSIFVARITAIMTVDAIQSDINSLSDLTGKRIATIEGSTSAAFLSARNLAFDGHPDLSEMLAAFESGIAEAVVFDAPILAFYVLNSGGRAQLAGPVVQRENYGIALPSGSPLAEQINQGLLRLRETGEYDRIYANWFGRLPD